MFEEKNTGFKSVYVGDIKKTPKKRTALVRFIPIRAVLPECYTYFYHFGDMFSFFSRNCLTIYHRGDIIVLNEVGGSVYG